MSAKPNRDSLPILRILTAEELDIVRLKLWKRFGEYLRAIQSAPGPDDLLREIVAELVEGKEICPGEKINPPTCLLNLVENRVNALAKPAKTQRQTIPEQPVNIEAIPIEKIREELLVLGTEIETFHAKIANMLGIHKLLSEKLKQWMLDLLWIPEGAGQPPTAASIPQQEYSFITEEGNIKIWCRWEEQHDNEPAYLWVSWETHITTSKELWILFLDPETQGIRSEVNLRTDLTGEATLTSNELGFDPSRDKWAVSIMLQETVK